jgi:hypothetical protein
MLDDTVNKKVSEYKDFTGYYVTLIPKNPLRFNVPFTPSDSSKGKQVATHENVRHVDGNTFYELATGRKDALREIFESLPKVLKKVISVDFQDQYAHSLALFNKAFGQ